MIGSHAAERALDTFFKEIDESDTFLARMERIHLLRGIEGVEQVTLLYALICKVQQMHHAIDDLAGRYDLLKDEYFKNNGKMLQKLKQAEAEIQTLEKDRDQWKEWADNHAERINAMESDLEKQEEKPQGETWLAKF